MTSPIIDDNDNNRMMDEGSNDQPSTTNSFYDSLRQLRHAVRELEKVNQQFAQLLDSLDTQAPCQLTLQDSANNLQPPQPCPALQRECPPQHILMQVTPPAPNPPASPLQHPANQLASQIDPSQCTTPGTISLVNHPVPTTIPCEFPWPPPTLKTAIPNWAKPAVPPRASNLMTGLLCTGKTHWPPP